MSAARPPIWVVFKAHLAADARKTGVLAVLFVVMVVVYARWFWSGSGPEEAAAASVALPVIPAQVASSGKSAPPLPPTPRRYKPRRPLITELTRDPFRVRLERFAVDPDVLRTEPDQQPPAATRPAWEPDFLLQSTITGSLPMAWINGRCVQPGEEVDGFLLERVEPGRVILRHDDVERVLTMD